MKYQKKMGKKTCVDELAQKLSALEVPALADQGFVLRSARSKLFIKRALENRTAPGEKKIMGGMSACGTSLPKWNVRCHGEFRG
jgi:hypothetical protein